MRRTIAISAVIIVALAIGYYTVSNYPTATTSLDLENGVVLGLELNEDLFASGEPVVSKKITLEYKKYELIHRSHSNNYDYNIFLLKEKKDTIWSLEEKDGSNPVQCSFTDDKTEFIPRKKSKKKCDTIMKIDFSNFELVIK